MQGRRRHLNVTVFSRNYSPHARIYEGEGAKEAGTIIVSQRVQMCGSPEGVKPFACEAVCVSARERAAVCDDMEIQKHAEALRKH